MYKTVQPPKNDMNFRSICANTETRVCFGHIRAASGTAIATVNNHPFAFGRHCRCENECDLFHEKRLILFIAFMHNGSISDFISIRRTLSSKLSDAVYASVFAATDSEHLAGLYMTYLTNHGDTSSFEKEYPAAEMASAMHKAVATVIELQQTIIGDSKRTPNSLNLCATDGVKLVVYRFRNHKTSQPPTLYYSTKAGTTLNRKYLDHPDGVEIAGVTDVGKADSEHGKHLIIASEPSTYKEADWELIGKNQCVLAEPDGTFNVADVPYDKAWDAEDHVSKAPFD